MKETDVLELDPQLIKRLIFASLNWRAKWVDVEDLQESASGCKCELCNLVRVCDELADAVL